MPFLWRLLRAGKWREIHHSAWLPARVFVLHMALIPPWANKMITTSCDLRASFFAWHCIWGEISI
jgi:hypothetical protein